MYMCLVLMVCMPHKNNQCIVLVKLYRQSILGPVGHFDIGQLGKASVNILDVW